MILKHILLNALYSEKKSERERKRIQIENI